MRTKKESIEIAQSILAVYEELSVRALQHSTIKPKHLMHMAERIVLGEAEEKPKTDSFGFNPLPVDAGDDD